MRTLISQDPYDDRPNNMHWYRRGVWPCLWVRCPDSNQPPFVSAYRMRFSLDKAKNIRAHVSADERYELFLDGQFIGRGPERGDPRNWFYETYDLAISPGQHTIVARVWSFGAKAPNAQMTVHPGFIFSPQDDEDIALLGTGVAAWEAKRLDGYRFIDVTIQGAYFAVGSNLSIDGKNFPWGFESGEGQGWQPVLPLHEGANGFTRVEVEPMQLLKPATLPAMLDKSVPSGKVRFISRASSSDLRSVAVKNQDHISDEVLAWEALFQGKGQLTIPAHTSRRVIIDLDNYYCAYPELTVSGGEGGQIVISWAESLFQEADARTKGIRNDIEGKYFTGLGDEFLPDGGQHRHFDTLWWRAGRYLEIFVSAAQTPLTIESLVLNETRYPIEVEMDFSSSDPRLAKVIPIAVRALQMCAHETFMDCPYYEQLMYVGDTRMEALVTYTISHDDRLPRKAIRMFDASRLPTGLTQSRYPSRVMQLIPPFSLWWIGMVHDYAMWRGDRDFIRSMIPGVRGVIDCFLSYLNSDDLVQAPNGWNYMDWVPSWNSGVPADGELGVSGVINWQYALALNLAAGLEEWLDEPQLAARDRAIASRLVKRIIGSFWDEKRQLFADDLGHQYFSEHAQCLAILSGVLSPEQRDKTAHGLLMAFDLAQTTIYFTHYLFETYAQLGAMAPFFDRLKLWFDLEPMGFKTTFEMPEPSRSDCHGWGSHPLFHYHASILGIRPASPGFQTVRIRPQLGPLSRASGSLVHPKGKIQVEYEKGQHTLIANITLPQGITGELVYAGKNIPLREGQQHITISDH